jgi:hypothetical protein
MLALTAGKPLFIILDEPDEEICTLVSRSKIRGHIEFIHPENIPDLVTLNEVRNAVNAGFELVTVAAEDVAAAKEVIRSLPTEDIDTAV